MRTQVFTKPGDKITHDLPFSEVCMSMKVAGKPMICELLEGGMVQLWESESKKFSFPVTAGEAGFYFDYAGDKGWYTYDS